MALLVAMVCALAAACSGSTAKPPTSSSAAPAGGEPTVASTCFTASGPDGKPYSIYGKRWTVGHPSPSTPAILLVHGVGSTTDVWDLTPQWSVARSLARAGYVVIGYDRLGYRHSSYDGAGAAEALTIGAQQSVLHDLVGQVHAGSYQTGAADGQCQQPAGLTKTSYASSRVAIIGHSAGGFIVSSYPAKYHDVVAMVQANAPSGVSSTNPAGDAALVSAGAPAAHGAMDDKLGPIGDTAHDRTPPAASAGYSYAPGSARAACEEFNLWRAGAAKDAATVLCDPANSTGTPKGEGDSLVAQALQANKLVPQTGAIPVLLADADHDAVMPGNANALELAGWKEHCNCDVSQFVLSNTAHAFMAHTSLNEWVSNVVTWLQQKGIAAGTTPPTP